MIVSGEEVTVGDFVATEFHPDEVGEITDIERGLPVVTVTKGPYMGRVRRCLYPGQLLTTATKGGEHMMAHKDYSTPLRTTPEGEETDTDADEQQTTVPDAEARA